MPIFPRPKMDKPGYNGPIIILFLLYYVAQIYVKLMGLGISVM